MGGGACSAFGPLAPGLSKILLCSMNFVTHLSEHLYVRTFRTALEGNFWSRVGVCLAVWAFVRAYPNKACKPSYLQAVLKDIFSRVSTYVVYNVLILTGRALFASCTHDLSAQPHIFFSAIRM